MGLLSEGINGRHGDEEDTAIVNMINGSGARIVWVGLGCPKQEAWMHAHHHLVNAMMVGVGAAFDFHAGIVKRAPLWMRRNGLEWVHRLVQDPYWWTRCSDANDSSATEDVSREVSRAN